MDDRHSVYRQIRAQRTYRTLGKMSWWRIVLGAALLLSVFLISGFFSQRLAAAGRFRAAEKLMLSPRWVETYRPALKAYIEAGVLYEDGDYAAAREAFSAIEGEEAAAAMASLSALRLAAQLYEAGDAEAARAALGAADAALLPEDAAAEHAALSAALSP